MAISLRNKFILYSLAFSGLAALILAIPTAVIPNHFFYRMTPVFWFDYIFLAVNSLLIGIYFASTYTSTTPEACVVEKKSWLASAMSFLGIACPVCNKILVFIFSATILMTYLEPIRPYISLASTILLIWLVTRRLKFINLSVAQ